MSSLQSPRVVLCPVMGSVEVNDFPFSLGMNRGHTGMCARLPLGISRVSSVEVGPPLTSEKGKSERARRKEGKEVSPSEENERDWKSAITALEITKWER